MPSILFDTSLRAASHVQSQTCRQAMTAHLAGWPVGELQVLCKEHRHAAGAQLLAAWECGTRLIVWLAQAKP